ncbi:MAG: maleylpyruvate isomerase family mycothiol-dependent enzyme [Acidimicrobiales bacterium]
MTDLRYDPLASLKENGAGLLKTASGTDLAAAVPSCPGWSLSDLVFHVSKVWTFWTEIVAPPLTTAEQVRNLPAPTQPDDDHIIAWAESRLESCLAVLETADANAEVWTWTGTNQPTSWVHRRMAQETAVHRWDVEHTATTDWMIDPIVASDGIDEFLMWHAHSRLNDSPNVGGSVHLHCTDADGEWTITNPDSGNMKFDRTHEKSDTAIKGEANALLLWVWRRPGPPVEIFGDTAVAERFQGS